MKDNSAERFGHLIGRMENGAEATYGLFKANEQSLNFQPLMYMSNITRRLMQNIDYKRVAKERRENYLFFQKRLKNANRLKLELGKGSVPLVYPYLVNKPNMRERLIRNKIFIAQYWPNVLERCEKSSVEYWLANNLLALPVDQRIEEADLIEICKLLGE